jgi:hypothetical protein
VNIYTNIALDMIHAPLRVSGGSQGEIKMLGQNETGKGRSGGSAQVQTRVELSLSLAPGLRARKPHSKATGLIAAAIAAAAGPSRLPGGHPGRSGVLGLHAHGLRLTRPAHPGRSTPPRPATASAGSLMRRRVPATARAETTAPQPAPSGAGCAVDLARPPGGAWAGWGRVERRASPTLAALSVENGFMCRNESGDELNIMGQALVVAPESTRE